MSSGWRNVRFAPPQPVRSRGLGDDVSGDFFDNGYGFDSNVPVPDISANDVSGLDVSGSPAPGSVQILPYEQLLPPELVYSPPVQDYSASSWNDLSTYIPSSFFDYLTPNQPAPPNPVTRFVSQLLGPKKKTPNGNAPTPGPLNINLQPSKPVTPTPPATHTAAGSIAGATANPMLLWGAAAAGVVLLAAAMSHHQAGGRRR